MTRLLDGFSTKITLTAFTLPTYLLVKTITPVGGDGGGPIDISTMLNTALRTFYHKSLITLSPFTAAFSYDSAFYGILMANLNVNQLITITLPDTHTVAFWGWIDKWQPGENVEGTMPLATTTFNPSNINNSLVETSPVYT